MLPNEISYARKILWSEPWAHNQSEWRHEKESKLSERMQKKMNPTIALSTVLRVCLSLKTVS
jgi:hypothetical protein